MVLASQAACEDMYNESAAKMMLYLSFSFSLGWRVDQSSIPVVTVLCVLWVSDWLRWMLCVRFGTMEVRSVRWMYEGVGHRAEKERPTRPVPAPSSRIRGSEEDGGSSFVEELELGDLLLSKVQGEGRFGAWLGLADEAIFAWILWLSPPFPL